MSHFASQSDQPPPDSPAATHTPLAGHLPRGVSEFQEPGLDRSSGWPHADQPLDRPAAAAVIAPDRAATSAMADINADINADTHIEPASFQQVDLQPADILIVDDTPENLKLLAALLASEHYQIRKAINGSMALRAVAADPPDLILLDIMMPDMDGYSVCQALKADPSTADIPVIFLSGLSDAFDKVRAFETGGSDYITKPFHGQEVLARVRTHLQARSAQQRMAELNLDLERRVRERTWALEQANAALHTEIQERQRLQEQLMDLVLRDDLTGLPNRTAFTRELAERFQAARQAQADRVAVLFVDCDRFKVVNDSLGHFVGDQLLISLAQRLQGLLEPPHLMARFGGDEFTLLLQGPDPLALAQTYADRVMEALQRSFKLQGHEIFTNASIGIAVDSDNYSHPEHLLRDADAAMYQAKTMGRGQYQQFNKAMHRYALQTLEMETELRHALQNQALQVAYQPIVCVATGELVGCEALVRWPHPVHGYVPPSMFIPVAEETGLIVAIGEFVLTEALKQIQQWNRDRPGDRPLFVSVNLSVRQINQQDFLEKFNQIVQDLAADLSCLKLEITEGVFMGHTPQNISVLNNLRDRQIQICVDDFGTGYSSLSYLQKLPVDILKIDRSFITPLDESHERGELVAAIIHIAQTMQKQIVAEGVETIAQLQKLQEFKCDFIQGYWVAKPLTVAEMENFLSDYPIKSWSRQG